jgi:hypothetical protein
MYAMPHVNQGDDPSTVHPIGQDVAEFVPQPEIYCVSRYVCKSDDASSPRLEDSLAPWDPSPHVYDQ